MTSAVVECHYQMSTAVSQTTKAVFITLAYIQFFDDMKLATEKINNALNIGFEVQKHTGAGKIIDVQLILFVLIYFNFILYFLTKTLHIFCTCGNGVKFDPAIFQNQPKKLTNRMGKFHSITARAKDMESLRKKIQDKIEIDENKEDELYIDDLAGSRVLLYFKSDIQRVVDLLRREFHVIEELDVRKRYEDCFGSLGYCCRHLVVTLHDRRRHFAEYRRFRNLRCEVQITTLLEHAWSEVEHDLYYKNQQAEFGETSHELEREFAAIANFLRHVDEIGRAHV